MSYNNYLISIILIITSVYLLNISQIAFSIDDTELQHICLPNNKSFTNNYGESRALVVINLIINTASNQGFSNATYNRYNNNGERAYGLAQCRGDVSDDDCNKCVNNATTTLINSTHCHDSRSAIMWRDYCLFKFSDVDFFGKLDTTNTFSMSSGNEWYISPNVILDHMKSLKKIAIESPRLYASVNDVSLNNNGSPTAPTLYGKVQCNKDLSINNCEKCLDSAISNLSILVLRLYDGARVVYESCFVRYETYSF